MQAVILAAGMGSRLKELTQDNTKCMVKMNGVTFIERMLRQIDAHGFSRIVIVVGYKGDKLIEFISGLEGIKTPIVYINNEIYNQTNNIYSLALAQDYLVQDDTMLFESDLLFENFVIDLMLNDPRESLMLVDKYDDWMDGTCVKLDGDDNITDFIPGKCFNEAEKDEYYKTVNIYKFSKAFSKDLYVPYLNGYMEEYGKNEYYEAVLRKIIALDNPGIRAIRLNGQLWYEVDNAQDLAVASELFKNR